MIHTRTWTVEIIIDEHDDERRTHAEARLRTGADIHLRGEGQARRNPADSEAPEIGDELAAARARGKARSAGPVLGLAVPVDPDLESVLQALECYAGDDVAVRLAVRR